MESTRALPVHKFPASSQTTRGRVRAEIQKAILSGQYPPGAQLRQLELAKRFGAAQTVVRESLLELQMCGLVRSVDNLGVFVEDLGPHQILQSYEIREVLEGLAARLCCERVSRAQIRELEEMAERIDALGREGKTPERGALDREFHQAIIHFSQNEVLARLTEAYRIFGMAVQAGRPDQVVRREHLSIVRAIAENKPQEAEQQARLHVRGARQAIEAQIATGGFQARWVLDNDEPSQPHRRARRSSSSHDYP